MGKKVNGVGCLHCAWVDAITKKYPKYGGKTSPKKNAKIADEIVQSALAIASRAMSSLNDEGKEKFLAQLKEETDRIEKRGARMRPLIEALLNKLTGGQGKIMTLDEVKAMIEGVDQPKN